METRTRTEYAFEGEGPDVPGPLMAFQLVRKNIIETRRRPADRWLYADQKRVVVGGGITRAQLADFIADAAQILSYIETEGGS
jgi:hypothetical protein